MGTLLQKSFSLFGILLLFIFENSHAQGSFSATLLPTVIGKNETTELKLIIENAEQARLLSIPALDEFYIIGGPNQESGTEIINGRVRRFIGYSYILKPKRPGKFTIGEAIARVDGKMLHSQPLRLQVTKVVAGSNSANTSPFAGLSPFDEAPTANTYSDFILKNGERVEDKINKNIFIRVETDKKYCYVGEPLLVTYKLYTRLKSESNLIRTPAFNGFSVVDLLPPNGEHYTSEMLNGRMYNVYPLRKVQLYPLEAGVDSLEAASVENKISFVKAAYINSGNAEDFLNGFEHPSLPAEAIITEKVMLKSKPVAIEVKPLPGVDSIANFHGAVGSFFIQATVDKTNFTTSDAARLQVSITGAGNITLLNPPEIKWPAGIEAFEAEVTENINRFSFPVSGTRVYSFPFTIDSPGKYTLPPVVMSYFDLNEKKYKTIQTKPIALTITRGSGPIVPAIAHNERTTAQRFVEAFFTHRWLFAVPVAFLILLCLYVWVKADERKEARNAASKQIRDEEKQEVVASELDESKLDSNPFEQSEKLLLTRETKAFYSMLDKELKCLLAMKIQLPLGSEKKEIDAAVDKSSLDHDCILMTQQLLGDIEMQLYTPFADEDIQSFYERAVALNNRLNQL